MKSKYSIGFLSCCACLIIAMTFAYQFSYQKAKARAEKLKLEEHYDELPELLRQEIRNGKYIESTAELYGFLENYSS